MHMWQEMAEYMGTVIGNPRLFWAYKDEDFVGFISELAHSRGGGGMSSTVPRVAITRYRALGGAT
jgi:hypothetical protein